MKNYHPPTFINAYLQSKLGEDFDVPFFPTSPTAIEDLTETFPQNNIFCVYDRMLKMRRTPFPHIKCEQLMYYFYAKGEDPVTKIIETTQTIQDLLDREDESAEDLNKWIKTKITGNYVDPEDPEGTVRRIAKINGIEYKVPYFHRLRIYQLQETRDIIDFGTARTYAGNKIIIDYDWHKS